MIRVNLLKNKFLRKAEDSSIELVIVDRNVLHDRLSRQHRLFSRTVRAAVLLAPAHNPFPLRRRRYIRMPLLLQACEHSIESVGSQEVESAVPVACAG